MLGLFLCNYGFFHYSLFKRIFSRFRKYDSDSISQILEQLFKLVFGLLFAKYFITHGISNGAAGAIFGVFLSEILSLLFLVVYFFVRKKKNTTTCESNLNIPFSHTILKLAKTSLPIMISAIILPFTLAIDSFLIVNLLGKAGLNPGLSTSLFGIYSGMVNSLLASRLLFQLH